MGAHPFAADISTHQLPFHIHSSALYHAILCAKCCCSEVGFSACPIFIVICESLPLRISRVCPHYLAINILADLFVIIGSSSARSRPGPPAAPGREGGRR